MMRSTRWWAPWRWELQRAIGWQWLLPLAAVVAPLAVMVASGTPPAQRPDTLREALEIGLPLISPFLVVPLLEAEWTRGTIALLAVRASLLRLLLARLLWVGVYLVLMVIGGSLISLLMAPRHASAGTDIQWLGVTLLIALAPTTLVAALALLAAHLAVEAAPGYLIAVAFWLVSLIAEVTLPSAAAVRALLLFGWTFGPSDPASHWLIGKVILLAVAALMLAPQVLVLRSEARFTSGMSD